MPALTGFKKKSVFHLWLKIQPPFAPFVYPKPPVAESLQTATLAHGHHGHAGWARMLL
jgi:hypothetical protein